VETLAETTRSDRALAEERRRQILAELGAARDGLDTNALADRLGLHPNTVRWHLGILGDAGLVRSAPERGHGRGRPSIVYRQTAAAAARGRDEYRLLATMLTGLAADAPEAEARAYDTGRRWGRFLVERPAPNEPPEPDAVATVVSLLDEQGFDASSEPGAVCMRRCPFYALAETNPEIVCTLHRGLIDGALEELGSAERVQRLDILVEPSLCVAFLSNS
jgi:predicted ArsR family transcriptional regulator